MFVLLYQFFLNTISFATADFSFFKENIRFKNPLRENVVFTSLPVKVSLFLNRSSKVLHYILEIN